jgi:hypothetical protein
MKLKFILLLAIVIFGLFGSDDTQYNTKEKNNEEISDEITGKNFLENLNFGLMVSILKCLNNEEIMKLKVTSKYFAKNMEKLWKMRMNDYDVFDVKESFFFCNQDDNSSRRFIHMMLNEKTLHTLPKLKLTSSANFHVYLEDRYEGLESILPGNWIEINENAVNEILIDYEKKQNLFYVEFENPESLPRGQYSLSIIFIRALDDTDQT